MISLDEEERLALIGERKDLVTARFEHAGNDQPRGAAGIDEHDAHQLALFLCFQAIIPSSLSLD
jgi:hypothetical protein